MKKELVRTLASLRLTVALLALAMVLIFLGTLAQVRMGVWEAMATYFRSWVAWVDPGLILPGVTTPAWLRFPIPGGLMIAGLMIVNLLAAHTVRFRLTAARMGIILLHAGFIVLLAGEFITGFFSNEALMRIDVGGSTSFVEDMRSVELAILDPTDPDNDLVISVPGRLIEKSVKLGQRVADSQLPFEVEVSDWHPNAQLLRATGATKADHGIGLEAVPEPILQARGVDGGASDSPAAYVTLYHGGERLGTWLVSADLLSFQSVMVAGKEYGISLRFKRSYLPYTMHLLEFRHDKFPGTQIPRNFSSRVRLVDPAQGTDREATIWMNNPLRYRGTTFYQASYKPDGSGTVLQVVKNPGAALPYVASALVAFGMVWHFLLTLSGYLRREAAGLSKPAMAKPEPQSIPSRRGILHTIYPMLIWAAAAAIACQGIFRPQAPGPFDMRAFSTIPVSAGGRIKPMDTAARHLVSIASGRQTVRGPNGAIPAITFMLNLVAQPDAVRTLPVVRVDHPGVLGLMHLAPEDAGRLTLDKIESHWELIQTQAHAASELSSQARDSFHTAVLKLHDQVTELLSHAALEQPYSIPPLGPDGEWTPFAQAFGKDLETGETHPAVAYQVAMLTAWNEGDASRFNKAVGAYLELLERDMPDVMRRTRLEVLFNRAEPFYGAMIVYVLAFLCICAGLLLQRPGDGRTYGIGWGEELRRSGLAMLWAAVFVHTVALLIRIYLQGRPPVTNLYSSAIFVGWAAVLLGLVLEHLHRLGVAAFGAASVGFASLVLAHNQGADGDTMQMMQAVLDSNFWLATHVVAITLGYSATLFAGALATVYLVMGSLLGRLSLERSRALHRMVYGTVCFALLLSFVGTVLGGIWADQSWGRFWGWDPKENGAALVVLINAIILHARWGGMIRERGMMVLALFGNIVTAWSWFGTNMLGVGLHSYGFTGSAFAWMIVFVVSQLLVMSFSQWRHPQAALAHLNNR